MRFIHHLNSLKLELSYEDTRECLTKGSAVSGGSFDIFVAHCLRLELSTHCSQNTFDSFVEETSPPWASDRRPRTSAARQSDECVTRVAKKQDGAVTHHRKYRLRNSGIGTVINAAKY